MATAPEQLRVPARGARTYSELVLDGLAEAVLLVDTRAAHKPVVLANAAAQQFFRGNHSGFAQDPCLYDCLAAPEALVIETTLAKVSKREPLGRVVSFRTAAGEVNVWTEFKLLDGDPGQRLVSLRFAAAPPPPELGFAIDQLPMDLLVLDHNLKITYANAAALRTNRLAPAKLLGCSALSVQPTAALPLEVYRRALAGTAHRGEPVAFTNSAGVTHWYEISVQPVQSTAATMGLLVLASDVTEAHERARTQASSESRLRALTENAYDVIVIADTDGSVQFVSGGVTDSLGYAVEERRGRNIFDHIHPGDRAAVLAQYRRMVAGETAGFMQEYRIQHKDGGFRWFECVCVPALKNPLIGGVVINARDVTPRKQAEQRLRQREELFRLATDAVDGVIFEWDVASERVQRSRGMLEVLGLSPEELAGSADPWRDRIHPPDLAAVDETVRAALASGRGWTTTYRLRDARDRYRLILERALIQRNAEGVAQRVVGCSVDVTELNRSRDLLAETQRATLTGGWEYFFRSGEMVWTEEMYRLHETTPADFELSLESARTRLTAESRERHEAALEAAMAAGHNAGFDLELELNTLKGNRIWVRMIGRYECLGDRPIRVFGSMQSIQAQKTAQIALERRSDWLKLSLNMAQMRAWRWDRRADVFEFVARKRGGKVLRFAAGFARILARLHPADRERVRRAIDAAFHADQEFHEEFRLPTRQGGYRSYATTARLLRDEAGQPFGLVGVTQDITTRREAEIRLRRAEELLRATTENTTDTLMLLDQELQVRFVNKVWPDPGGSLRVGDPIAAFLPPAAREPVLAKLRQVLATGEPASHEYEAGGASGRPRHVECRAVRVPGSGGSAGLSLSVRDITDRKRLEREILDVVSRERQRIGRDLHDGLGQELTGIALMLRGLARRIEQDRPESLPAVEEIMALVNESIESTRSLARGLLPVSVERGGLGVALRQLAERGGVLYGMEVRCQTESWPELRLDETAASHLYRIAQEALTNAARHGHASRVEIALRVNDHAYELQIVDDGEGMPLTPASCSGLGLRIMGYRAKTIGARLEIGRNEPRGTRVRVIGDQRAVATGV